MEFTFTLFQPHREKKKELNEPAVELRPNGRIMFNKKACELLSNYQYCMLGYDQKNNAIGLLPLAENQINAFPIRYAAKGAYIGAKKFFKYFDILPQQQYTSAPFNNGQFIAIKL